MLEMMFIQAIDYRIHPLRRIFKKPKLRQSRRKGECIRLWSWYTRIQHLGIQITSSSPSSP